jgi:serine/threonine protein kinase
VHRDIKPANVMLNRRGAEPDVVKVLDFGLVKAIDEQKEKQTQDGSIAGTPLYMSPESLQTPDAIDACSDLYAVGAVGYFLLTGAPPFTARSLNELCQQHLTAIPESPSRRLGRTVSAELEHAILSCLEKSRAKRPQTARDLQTLLDRVPASWTLSQAEEWWSRHERSQPPTAACVSTAASDVVPAPPPQVALSTIEASATQIRQTPLTTITDVDLSRTSIYESRDDDK